MKVSIIIPVYNEERTIGEILDRVWAVDLGDIEREVVIVDDGSSDATRASIAANQHTRAGRVQVHQNPVNLGKGAAVRLGLSVATGDVLLVQDADLEFDPQEHGRLLQPILEGRADIVYGSRFLDRASELSRKSRLANRFLTSLTNVLFWSKLTDMETAHKVFRREVLDDVRLRCVGFDFEPEVTAKLLLAGHRIVEVPISYKARSIEEGKKLRWTDGLDAVYTLIKCRVTGSGNRKRPVRG
ncbi:MAG: glycosyltransferase family 2 protein [Acidobacteria bacterium]|nr:glycosyltransferase family 2 protein [Acidobacteriota bacterium]